MVERRLTAIDLFSGAGGFSLAAKNAKVDVLAAIELDEIAAETYYNNLVAGLGAPTEVFAQDITKVDIDSIMRFQGISKGDVDILLGGPPCQGFSSHRINNSGIDDPRNALLLRYFDFVERFKPKAFLVENVPGLLWKKHETYLKKFLSLAKKHGYKIVSGGPLIMNARDYGVPQNRRRAIIFAIRKDISLRKVQWPPQPTHGKKGEEDYLTASTVFERPDDHVLVELIDRLTKKFGYQETEAENLTNNLTWGLPLPIADPCDFHMVHTPEIVKVFEQTPVLGSREDSGRELDCHKNYKGHRDVYGRIFPHLPSNTITTGCNNPSKGRFVHPWLPHGISLRHAARLQTFPDDYVFSGGSMSMARQIGNAVPVALGQALISHIDKILRL
jgi:DNA (cytosine-5)-methyltransferase 1